MKYIKIKLSLKLYAFMLIVVIMCLALFACGNSIESSNVVDLTKVKPADKPEELQIIIQESPPFSFTVDGEMTGFVAEIVKEVMTRQNIETDFTVLPFKRGYELVSQEPMTVLCGMTRTLEREDLFKWVGPITQVKTGFYAKKDANVMINTMEDAKIKDSIGVTLGYYTETLLKKENFNNLDSVVYPEDMLEKLIVGRTSLLLSDNIAMSGLLKSANISPDDVEMVYEVLSAKSYLAFSLNTPDEVVNKWQDVLDEVYKDGTIQEIYEFWLPNVTPPPLD